MSTPSIPNTPRSDRRYREMKNAVATFQTISAMVVAIAASVSPSMLMKTTPAMTLTAALRISSRSGCGAFGHRQDGQRDR